MKQELLQDMWVPVGIVAGGQTGTDRGALDAARALGLRMGGWCPMGRRAEDGVIPASYPLWEANDSSYAHRTRANVLEADAVLVFVSGFARGEGSFALREARSYKTPHLVVDLDETTAISRIRSWVQRTTPFVLHVTGPRESQVPGAAAKVQTILVAALSRG